MALPFPDVPIAPGVPALPRGPIASVTRIALLAADVISFFAGSIGPQWGLFQDGVSIITADSVVDLDFLDGSLISNYPLEGGAFESYNKVASPYDAHVRFASGGSTIARQALLQSIAAAKNSLDLFDLVTPDAVYLSVNVIRYDYHRGHRRGAGLLSVDVFCEQVRQNASAAFSSTKEPNGAGQKNGGNVQTQTAPPGATSQLPLVM